MRNNNRKISVLLAKREYQADRGRSRILTGVVALAVLTLFCVYSFAAGKVETDMLRNARERGTVVNTTLERATKEQYEQIQKLSYIKHVGTYVCFGSISTAKCAVIDEAAWENIKSPAFTDIHGNYPQGKTDVMLPVSTLERLGISEPEIGMEISLDIELKDGRQEGFTFYLSGYYTEYINTLQYGPPDAYFSDAFLDSITDGTQWDTTLLLRQDDRLAGGRVENMLYSDIRMRDDSQQFIGGNTMTWEAFARMSGGFGPALVMAVAVLACTGLLIYNVLNISFSRSIRKFGLLKTLGTTEKQLRHIAFLQVGKIIWQGSLIGAVPGTFTALVIIPALLSKMYLDRFGSASGMITFRPALLAGSVLFGAAITFLSSVFAIRRVVRLTPIESMNYMEEINIWAGRKKLRQRNKGTHKGIHKSARFELARMAWRNILRFKKRFTVAVISLTLGLLISLGMIMVSKGSDTTNEIEHDYWDFFIYSFANSYNPEPINPYDLFPETLVNQIENLTGIQDIVYTRGGYGEVLLEEKALEFLKKYYLEFGHIYRTPFVVQILDDEHLGELKEFAKEKKLYLDVDRVMQGEGVILLHDHWLSHAQIEKSKDTVGMSVGIYSFDDGKKTRDMEFCGYLDVQTDGLPDIGYTSLGRGDTYFLASEKGFKSMGIKEQIFDIDINAKPGSEFMLYDGINNIITEYNRQFEPVEARKWKEESDYDRTLHILAKMDILSSMKNYIISSRLVMGALCAVLLFMGLVNYVNVTATGLVIRKKEFAVMASIGMTEKQLKKMLLLEGMIYGLIISVLTAVLGTGLLWLSGRSIKKGMEYFVFHYPVAEYAGCVIVLFVLCILIVFPRQSIP